MKTYWVQRFVSLTAILIASTAFVVAQSGRRSTPKSPVPAPPPVSETNLPKTKPDTPPRLQLLVGIQEPGAFEGVPPFVADNVIRACVERLNEHVGVSATVTSRNINRGEAVKLAKSESQRYVIWLEVRSDAMDASRRSSRNRDDLFITYVIFEPTTAKIKQSGRAQHGVYSKGNVGIGLPPTSGGVVYSDYAIQQSAREAADKILAAFKIPGEDWPR